jgi:hypothetical protein
MEAYLLEQSDVKNLSMTMGASPLRYYLASPSFGPKPNYANILIELNSSDSTKIYEERFDNYLRKEYPNVWVRSSLFNLAPAVETPIEIGFIGNNPDTLQHLCNQVMEIMRQNDHLVDIRSSWGNKIPTWKPSYSQDKGQRLAISRKSMASSLKVATNGIPLGSYREKDLLMPILLKAETSTISISTT